MFTCSQCARPIDYWCCGHAFCLWDYVDHRVAVDQAGEPHFAAPDIPEPDGEMEDLWGRLIDIWFRCNLQTPSATETGPRASLTVPPLPNDPKICPTCRELRSTSG